MRAYMLNVCISSRLNCVSRVLILFRSDIKYVESDLGLSLY